MKKNILICLEKLGIGGVETAVVNQAIALKENGNNVVVMAEKGIYTPKLQENNIETIDFKFELTNKFNIGSKEQILSIIKKYDINQIHIHQFPCIQYVWQICLEYKIPYFVYVHSISMDDFAWFMNTYSFYKIALKPYFKYAQKIIVLAKEAIDNHKKWFPTIDEDKYFILPNCINLERFHSKEKVQHIEKFALISRFSNEKMESIKNSIDLFLEFSKINSNDNIQLDIIGGGKNEQEIKEYIANYSNIKLVGETNEIETVIDKYDAVLGIGRCILEGIAMNKITILSGIDNLKGIVNTDNIDKIMHRNFVGRELEDVEIKKVAEELNMLNETEIDRITSNNYKKIEENLNIKTKMSFVEQQDILENNHIIQEFVEAINFLINEIDNEKRISKEIWDAKQWLVGQVEIEQKEKMELIKEINNLKTENK